MEQFNVQISLEKIEDMFGEPEANPFIPGSRYVSGIDEIVGQMRLKPRELHHPACLVIRLPQTAVSPNTQTIFKEAMERYCSAKILENQQAIKEIRVLSRRQAISALVIVAVLFLFTILLVNTVPGLQQVGGAIAGFVGIAVWVIFWDPIYNYVYAWRPNKLDLRIFENLQTADLVTESITAE